MAHSQSKEYETAKRRNRNPDEDPAVAFQAEHTMIRLEHVAKHGHVTHCVKCGKKIPKARLKAIDTVWCIDCQKEYEAEEKRMRGPNWHKTKHL